MGEVDHIPELLATKHNGLLDVKISPRISGKRVSATYTFDGKAHVGK